MPYLRILDIHFKYHLYGDDDPSTYDSLLKKFNSSFWIERQWFFTHRLGSRKGQIHGLLYPIGQYKINRDEYLILCKYLSPWFIGDEPENLANKLFDLFNLNVQSNQIDFIHFIRLWNILWNEDFKDKLIILFLSHLEDENKRKEGFKILLEPTSVRSSSETSEKEEIPSLYIENGEITYVKSSQLPLMNQTEVIHLCKSIYSLMTGAIDDENLFKALTTSSTLLLKMGEMCKSPPHQVEIDDNKKEIENEWTITFEQFEAAMNAETCLVTWFENNNGNNLSLETRINNYHQDTQR
ncbi:unnamed protein product [Rotaria sp. Silwood1]|nr:unnamed protein product [Rotaria sp. Silwood1]